ncbi:MULTISPECIES: response regulator [unclassified Polynucleobacter]|uniref:response regulator transcription factor n=1 Tax=unclassified Polynucleobacter TaxID=2640945 RepID=UPI0008AD301B|nr:MULTISPECIES: response regulator [unclassified Polynucleobacter]OHC10331.1 MAG: hypothetical protein A2X74_00335 [Polynucleobacter sp. GWA2_45_21]HBK44159.1 hypothetical protein [Polynucleobacter sp.]
MKNTRVIIVEDDLAVQRGLVEWLSDDHEIKCYPSAELFLGALNNFEFEDGIPSCILLDFQMPGMNGVELQGELKRMNAAYPIVFMSGNAKQADIIDAWHGGAVDFILKPFSGDQISIALIKLLDTLKEDTAELTLTTEEIDQPISIPISPREAQALLLLGKGHRQSEVAEIMGIALTTVKMYRTILKNKLNLYTPVELSRYCDRYKSRIEEISKVNSK